jgi:hypothetical protein
MNNKLPFAFILTFLSLFTVLSISAAETNFSKDEKEKAVIAKLLDDFNVAAANAEYEKYFNFYAEDGIFIGTDATENWDKKAFMIWAKPYFDKKRTWNFKSIERHIFLDKSGKVAWFDELLDTQMKICRGSGVLSKQGKDWKIQQYVLSMTIPNDNVDAVVKIKAPIEEALMKKLTNKQ